VKLTERTIAKLKAARGRQVLYWDEDLPGFGVLVSGTTNTKTFIVKGAVAGRGVRRKIGRTGVMSLSEAHAKAKGVMVGFGAGIDPRQRKASDVTLREILDGYLKRASLKPRSREFYSGAVTRYFADWLDKPLGSITSDMVETRHREIAEEVAARDAERNARMAKRHLQRAERTEEHYPEASARHRALWKGARERKSRSGHGVADGAMRCLRALFNFAIDEDDSLTNPVRLKGQWFEPPPRERLVSADDLPAFHAAVASLENKVASSYLRFLLFSGMRRREAAALRWSAVDLRGAVIRVPASSTKSGKKLDLPLTDVIRDILIGLRGASPTFVFPSPTSKSGHIEEPKSALAEVAAKCGKMRVSVHDLRRSYATIAERVVSFIELKCLLNHAAVKDVTGNYVAIGPKQLSEAAQKVADRIKELCGLAEPGGNVVELGKGRGPIAG
jgi:integrase